MQTIHSPRGAQTSADFSLASASIEHLLVREFTHRVNNEFTSVIGLAGSIANRSTSHEVKSAIAQLTTVLHCFAEVHRALQMPSHSLEIDASAYVSALCHSLKRARLDPQGIELVLVSRPFKLSSERCWKLGLIISELITNSARHAFGNRGGRIEVLLSASDSSMECCVRDSGSVRRPCRIGHGLKIIDALAQELGGSVSHKFGPEGATSLLRFPVQGEAPFIDASATRTRPAPGDAGATR
ncbi:sensor histidine kinase [Bradyrhizobium sp. SYSU BS000235]|jgi:two-component sensor histidine kinase|uniref:sensor histidine kinase n=1 Tax=Bradyrhizobium sp. SYSU BS000235 TaxID=3411332 RepID=UPI003C725F9B